MALSVNLKSLSKEQALLRLVSGVVMSEAYNHDNCEFHRLAVALAYLLYKVCHNEIINANITYDDVSCVLRYFNCCDNTDGIKSDSKK